MVENTDNQSTGSSTTFQIRINSTHGVSTSITKTKDTDASASGSLIVGPNSTSIQENKDGASGFMQQGGGTGLGQTTGVSGFQRINFGEGTRYDASVRSLTSDEFCAGSSSCSLPEMGNASASATGNTSTVISVESTESSFCTVLFVLLRLNDDCAIFSYAANNFIYMFLSICSKSEGSGFYMSCQSVYL